MKELFAKRKQDFRLQCLKYLRYVFNDHFVLFLLIFMGFLGVQYSQLLRHFPTNHLPIIASLSILSVFILSFGRIATYLEKPDALFLLVRESEVRAFIKVQILRSYLLYAVLQTGLLLLLAPLFLALGLPVWGFGLYCLLILVLKWFLFQAKAKKFFTENGLDWQALVAYEAARKQTLLRFFALFTNVKGISNSVKRRAYLDGLTRLVGKQHSKTWQNLLLHAKARFPVPSRR